MTMEAVAIEGLEELNRKLNKLATVYSIDLSRKALAAMAQPLKSAIRKQVNNVAMSAGMKRDVRTTIGSTLKKDKGTYLLRVGLGVGKETKARAAQRKRRGGKPGVGISKQNVHWVVFGTGRQSQLAGTTFTIQGGKKRESRATGGAREKESGASTGSTYPYLAGMLPVAIHSGTPGAVLRAGQKLQIELRKYALRGR